MIANNIEVYYICEFSNTLVLHACNGAGSNYTSASCKEISRFPLKAIVQSLIAGFPSSESALFSGIYSDIAVPPHNDPNSPCELLMLLRRGILVRII